MLRHLPKFPLGSVSQEEAAAPSNKRLWAQRGDDDGAPRSLCHHRPCTPKNKQQQTMKVPSRNDDFQRQNSCAPSCENDDSEHCCCTPWTRVGEEERRYWFVGAARKMFGPQRGRGGGGEEADGKFDGDRKAGAAGRGAEKEVACRMQAAALLGRRGYRCCPVDRNRRAMPRCFSPAPRRAATLVDVSPLWLFPVLLVVTASLLPAASCQIVEEQRKGVDDWTPDEVVFAAPTDPRSKCPSRVDTSPMRTHPSSACTCHPSVHLHLSFPPSSLLPPSSSLLSTPFSPSCIHVHFDASSSKWKQWKMQYQPQ